MSDLTPEQRERAIQLALSVADKEFGKGSLYVYGKQEPESIPVIPTGSVYLDRALGVGGLPRGRIVEIFGPESSGKTTMALHVISEAQKLGGTCAFIDAEHALDMGYANALGVDIEKLILSQPTTGEEALRLVELLVKSGGMDLVVVDSVAALVPKAELEGSIGDSHVGLQARLMSQAMRMLAGTMERTGTTVIFINQIRSKIGVMFGSPETTSGGNALKFYASVRLDVRRKAAIRNGEEIIGNEVDIKVVKNKVAPPFKTASTRIMYGRGIDRPWEIVEEAIAAGLVEKSGSWFTLDFEGGGSARLQGHANLLSHLQGNPEVLAKLDGLLREMA